METIRKVGGLMIGVALGLLLVSHPGEAQVKRGRTRAAETKYLMKGVIQPSCAAIGALLKQDSAEPGTWDKVATHASVINELSYSIMDDGRCPDSSWAGAAKTLRESSAQILAAAQEKNVVDARAAFKSLTTACATCHKSHRKP